MLSIDLQYLNRVKGRLDNFTQRDIYLWNFSCPICGDGEGNKKRGYVMLSNDGKSLVYHCHNDGCGSHSFKTLLRTIDESIVKDYEIDTFKTKINTQDNKKAEAYKIPKAADPNLKPLKKISQLQYDHPCRLYLDSRKIPTRLHHKLYYCPTFKSWTNTMLKDKFDLSHGDEERLIIPFFDKDKNMYAYQGRALDNREPRYITIKLDESKPKIYGIDTVDFNKKYYVLEGVFDAIFVTNALAACGSSLIADTEELDRNIQNAVLVFDNEPFKASIFKEMERAIDRGFSIMIWPSAFACKDINEFIVKGGSREDVYKMFSKNTYRGLDAKLRLVKWRRSS